MWTSFLSSNFDLDGNGFHNFKTPQGVRGLARHNEDRLDILSVVIDDFGKGKFRDFVTAQKTQFKTICIWEIRRPWLIDVLKRYGFTPELEAFGNGEILAGMRWDGHERTAFP
jgi:hypothetical protein